MHYTIRHTTRYSYDRPVYLEPSLIRLRPQADGTQALQEFQIRIHPSPTGMSEVIDAPGNSAHSIWFTGQKSLDYLSIITTSQLQTFRTNPFDYVFDSQFPNVLPARYEPALHVLLAPALARSEPDDQITTFAQTWAKEAGGDVLNFLIQTCRRLSQDIAQVIRHEGDPQSPIETWQQRSGACRDLAVLFMDICRSVGLAARFVSGYADGLVQQDRIELHAWVQVYLPGGGWRGYDPTMGIAVADRHIALACSAAPQLAAPFAGTFRGPRVDPHLMYDIAITTHDDV